MPDTLDQFIKRHKLPQPVSTAHWDDGMDRLPLLAAKVMRIIAIWSRTEAMVVSLHARLLPREWVVVSTISMSMRAYETHKAVLLAAAKHKLPGVAHDLFRATLESLTTIRKIRNQLAHGVWESANVPDALLCVEAELVTGLYQGLYQPSYGATGKAPLSYRYKDIFVWTASDLDAAVEQATDAFDSLMLLFNFLTPEHGDKGSLWIKLWNKQSVQAELQKIYAPERQKQPKRPTREEREALPEKMRTPSIPAGIEGFAVLMVGEPPTTGG